MKLSDTAWNKLMERREVVDTRYDRVIKDLTEKIIPINERIHDFYLMMEELKAEHLKLLEQITNCENYFQLRILKTKVKDVSKQFDRVEDLYLDLNRKHTQEMLNIH